MYNKSGFSVEIKGALKKKKKKRSSLQVPLAYGSVLAWYGLKSRLSAPPEDEEKEDEIKGGG